MARTCFLRRHIDIDSIDDGITKARFCHLLSQLHSCPDWQHPLCIPLGINARPFIHARISLTQEAHPSHYTLDLPSPHFSLAYCVFIVYYPVLPAMAAT